VLLELNPGFAPVPTNGFVSRTRTLEHVPVPGRLEHVPVPGRLEHVPVDINGVIMFTDFEVIEIVDDNCPYPALLGIDWDFNNSIVVDLKKRHMNFERDGLRVIAPLDPNEVQWYTEPIREEDRGYALENIYKITTG
jgi:hypothetical protein